MSRAHRSSHLPLPSTTGQPSQPNTRGAGGTRAPLPLRVHVHCARIFPAASPCLLPPASWLLQSSACDSAACKNQKIPKALKGKMVSSGRHRTSERSRASHRVRCPIPRQVTP
ncbi:hypothetical protein GQ55_6G206200 [Panicum hallii var. hallii]|uniref:Uncharacterized protein n=1 Tax=Panicum hallii var. hallii TaxID=1504633 RepID=A0A2T7D7X8_9POAL|nr:hypothetical protein GQ55_6G206200 [Panicum hallii var. hallii]